MTKLTPIRIWHEELQTFIYTFSDGKNVPVDPPVKKSSLLARFFKK